MGVSVRPQRWEDLDPRDLEAARRDPAFAQYVAETLGWGPVAPPPPAVPVAPRLQSRAATQPVDLVALARGLEQPADQLPTAPGPRLPGYQSSPAEQALGAAAFGLQSNPTRAPLVGPGQAALNALRGIATVGGARLSPEQATDIQGRLTEGDFMAGWDRGQATTVGRMGGGVLKLLGATDLGDRLKAAGQDATIGLERDPSVAGMLGEGLASTVPALGAGLLGGAPAGVAAAYLMGAGDVQSEFEDIGHPDERVGTLLLAVPYAALEYAMPAGVLERLGGRRGAQVIIAQGLRGAFGRIARDAFTAAIEEGGTEALQSLLTTYGTRVPTGEPVDHAQALRQAAMEGAAGALTGGVIGGAQGVVTETAEAMQGDRRSGWRTMPGAPRPRRGDGPVVVELDAVPRLLTPEGRAAPPEAEAAGPVRPTPPPGPTVTPPVPATPEATTPAAPPAIAALLGAGAAAPVQSNPELPPEPVPPTLVPDIGDTRADDPIVALMRAMSEDLSSDTEAAPPRDEDLEELPVPSAPAASAAPRVAARDHLRALEAAEAEASVRWATERRKAAQAAFKANPKLKTDPLHKWNVKIARDQEAEAKAALAAVRAGTFASDADLEEVLAALPAGEHEALFGDVMRRGFRAIEDARDRIAGAEEVEAESAPEAPAAVPHVPGAQRKVVFPDATTKVPVRYAVVEADALIPSNSPATFQPDARYPAQVQGRIYHGEEGRAAREEVVRARTQFQPELALDPTFGPEKGPPVVTPEGVVIAGNGRAMILAGLDAERAQAYRSELEASAGTFGFDPRQLAGMRRPVLVRMTDPMDAATMGRLNQLSDTSVGKAKGGLVQGAGRAQQLRAAGTALRHFADTFPEDGTLSDYLASKDGRDFVRALVRDGVILEQEQGRLLDARDRVSPEGALELKRLLQGAALGDVSLANEVSQTSKGTLDKLDWALPAVVQTAGMDAYDLTPALQGAFRLIVGARQNSMSLADYLGQGDLLAGAAPAPGAVALAQFLEASPRDRVAKGLRTYAARAAEARREAESGDMFGYTPPSREALLADLTGLRVAEAGTGPYRRSHERNRHQPADRQDVGPRPAAVGGAPALPELERILRERYRDPAQLALALGAARDLADVVRGDVAVRQSGNPNSPLHGATTTTVVRKALADWIRRGRAFQAVGLKVATAIDLAAISQVYRDPRYEKFRVFFVKDAPGGVQHEIVHVEEMTIRFPNQAAVYPPGEDPATYMQALFGRGKAMGATGLYMQHNHPTGNPDPSTNDRVLTQEWGHIARLLGMTLHGHVIIDHELFSVLNPDGSVGLLNSRLPGYGTPDPLLATGAPVPPTQGVEHIADVAMQAQASPEQVTLVLLDSRAGVRAVMVMPADEVDAKMGNRAWRDRVRRAHGVVMAVAVTHSQATYDQLLRGPVRPRTMSPGHPDRALPYLQDVIHVINADQLRSAYLAGHLPDTDGNIRPMDGGQDVPLDPRDWRRRRLREINAYHGSPRRDIDQFSTDYIGTGEGAQVYGWGLYFATKKDVAEWYRKNLAGDPRRSMSYAWERLRHRGHPVFQPPTQADVLPDAQADALLAILRGMPTSAPLFQGGDTVWLRKQIRAAQARAKEQRNLPADYEVVGGPGQDPHGLWRVVTRDPSTGQEQVHSRYALETDARKWVRSQRRDRALADLNADDFELETERRRGGVYHVRLAPNDDEWLDWDKPFEQQSPKVQAAVTKLLKPHFDQAKIEELDRKLAANGQRIMARQDEVVAETEQEWAALADDFPHIDPEGMQTLRGQLRYHRLDNDPELVRLRDEYRQIEKELERVQGADPTEQSGRSLYETLSDMMQEAGHRPADKAASLALLAEGVRGTRYLDGSSRGNGEGTHNYVVFDGKDVAIDKVEEKARPPYALREQNLFGEEQPAPGADNLFGSAEAGKRTGGAPQGMTEALAKARALVADPKEQFLAKHGKPSRAYTDALALIRRMETIQPDELQGRREELRGEAAAPEATPDQGTLFEEGRPPYPASDPTDTPEFRRWFGDSKVVDHAGKPKVVYHGTQWGDFEVFARAPGGLYKTQATSINAIGSWFTDAEKDARLYAAADATGGAPAGSRVVPVYLSIQNPLRIQSRAGLMALWEHHAKGNPRGHSGDPEALRAALKAAGYDGLVVEGSVIDGTLASEGSLYYVALEPTQIKSATRNAGTFDPADPSILREEGRPPYEAAEPRLAVLHNLTDRKLAHADKLGGLVTPSLAVQREDQDPETGFGDITLIGPRELADPAAVPVFDADAYSPRHPPAVYPVQARQRKARSPVWQELFDLGKQYDDLAYTLLDSDSPARTPAELARDLQRTRSWQARYLQARGLPVPKPVSKPKVSTTSLLNRAPAIREALEALTARMVAAGTGGPVVGDALEDEAFLAAYRRYADDLIAKEAAARHAGDDTQPLAYWERVVREEIEEDLYEDEDAAEPGTQPAYHVVRDLLRDAENLDKTEVDKPATDRKFARAMRGRDADFMTWTQAQVAPLFGSPKVRVGRSWKPYTLENAVAANTAGDLLGQEGTATFGPGKARAVASRTITSLTEARNRAGHQLGSPAEVDADRDRAEALREGALRAVMFLRTDGVDDESVGVWDTLDGLHEAIGRWGKAFRGPGKLLEAFRKVGIPLGRPDREAMQPILDYANAVLDARSPYFEAKPQRAVRLSEFPGAVVPHTVSPETLAILQRHGITVMVYDGEQSGEGRKEAVRKLRAALADQGKGTLFEEGRPPYAVREFSAYHGSPRGDIQQFSTDHIGSGEGAQAYGWGLYFASSKAVAAWYRNRLARPDSYTARRRALRFDGEDIHQTSGLSNEEKMFLDRIALHPFVGRLPSLAQIRAWVQERAKREAGVVQYEVVPAELKEWAEQGWVEVRPRYEDGTLGPATSWDVDGPPAVRDMEVAQAVARERTVNALGAQSLVSKLDRLTVDENAGRGGLYTVRLAPEEHELLDWDKPMAAQSDLVKRAVDQIYPTPSEAMRDRIIREVYAAREAVEQHEEKVRVKVAADFPQSEGVVLENRVQETLDDDTTYTRLVTDYNRARRALARLESSAPTTGEAAYRAIAQLAGWEGASKALLAAGVRGIRYLDGSSRNAPREWHVVASDGQILQRVSHSEEAANEALEEARLRYGPRVRLVEVGGNHNFVIFDGADVRINAVEEPARSPYGNERGAAPAKVVSTMGLLATGLGLQASPNPTLRGTGLGLAGLAALSAAAGPASTYGKASYQAVVAKLRQSPSGRRVIEFLDPDALLSDPVRQAILDYERTRAKAQARAGERFKGAAGTGPAADRVISDDIEGEAISAAERATLTPAQLTAVLVEAAAIQKDMVEVTAEKVRLGLLHPATAAKYAGGRTYLPRKYAMWEALAVLDARGGPPPGAGKAIRIQKDWARELGTSPEDLQVREELGEIREASYRVAAGLLKQWHQVAAAQLFQTLRATPGTLEPTWQQAAADLLTALRAYQAAAPGSPARQQARKDMDDARFLMAQVRDAYRDGKGDFIALPDNATLGVLRGAVVERAIAREINGLTEFRYIGPFMRWWKVGKTAYNPGTHVGNVMSNFFVTHLAGMPMPRQLAGLPAAMRDLRAYGPATKALAEAGVLNANALALEVPHTPKGYATLEGLQALLETTRPATAVVLDEPVPGSPGIQPRTPVQKALGAIHGKATGLYNNEDNVFRVLYFQWLRQQGVPEAEAIERAREDLINFRSRSPLLNLMRQTFWPFILYPAKALPQVGKLIAAHPWRYVAFMALWAAINEVGRELAGDMPEEDLPERDRKGVLGYTMPPRVQLPYRGRDRAYPTIDVARWTPLSALTQGAPPGTVFGAVDRDFPGVLAPGGPMASVGARLSNTDPYTGEKLFSPADTKGDVAYKVLRETAREALPSALGFHGIRVAEDLLKYGDPGRAATDALGLAGFKPQMVTPGGERRRARLEAEEAQRKIVSDLRSDLRKAKDPAAQARMRDHARTRWEGVIEDYRRRTRDETWQPPQLVP